MPSMRAFSFALTIAGFTASSDMLMCTHSRYSHLSASISDFGFTLQENLRSMKLKLFLTNPVEKPLTWFVGRNIEFQSFGLGEIREEERGSSPWEKRWNSIFLSINHVNETRLVVIECKVNLPWSQSNINLQLRTVYELKNSRIWKFLALQHPNCLGFVDSRTTAPYTHSQLVLMKPDWRKVDFFLKQLEK